MVGEVLSIKPVVGVEDGEVVMLGKARGSKNGRNQLHQQVEKHGIDFTMPVLLGYTGLSDKLLRKYLDDNRAIWEHMVAEEDLPIASVGATIGTHVGPGASRLPSSPRTSAAAHCTMRMTSWMSWSMGMGSSSAVQVRMIARMPER